MKLKTDYQMPWRPIYEGYLLIIWGSSILAFFSLSFNSRLPKFIFFLGMGYALIMFLITLPGARSMWVLQKGISGKKLTFTTLSAVKLIMKSTPNSLWLGYGFEWTAAHTQKLIDYQRYQLKHDLTRKMPSDAFGSNWIHGLNLGDDAIYQPLAHTEGHTLIVGTTGAGKTRCFDTLITQAILRNEAVIIIDPKGDKELCDNAKRACIASGDLGRFVFFHPGFPEISARINPLRNFNRGTEIASRIAALIPSETGADPFKAFGQMALNNIVQGLLIIGRKPDLKTLRYYLESGPDELVIEAVSAWCLISFKQFEVDFTNLQAKANRNAYKLAHYLYDYYFIHIQSIAPNSDLEGLLSMFKHDKTHYSKMVASLMPILNMLTSSELGPLLSPERSDPDINITLTDSARIIQTASVAYIGLDSLTDAMVGSAIGSLILSDLTAVSGDRYNYGIDNQPVNIFIDEAAEVINDPFIQLLNKGRGAKMRCIIATQTFSDFAARTGSEAKARQVLGNINNLIVFRVMDAQTQQYVTENLPKVRVNTVVRDQGGSTKGDDLMEYSGSYAERLMEEEMEIFPSAMLGQLPNLEYLAMISGGRLIKGRLPILVADNLQMKK
ncbi:conjugative transfer system coupling protein TraD [Thorsellia anophelis]|uniref:Conjugal transfer pilus assembly protein TraD n=1 Tax=Thorsellia anophelis DSM 18579 TaxID=1123402 RepID=A0A1I0DTD8_9GAMM|nr:conjugative transfer system coupling protein TraD [Thorsellia anophelis]SET35708.1 conjugal transfer pilus assembly protein TraD [Thorsellia anophelis DSM 18579]